jgi:MFS family permease
MLGFSVLGGLSASLIWTSTIATIGHWFSARRGLATGLATTAGGIGGIIFPILIQTLIPQVGYPWAVRIIAFICVGFSSAGVALMSTRLPSNTAKKPRFDFQGFTDKRFTLTIAAIFVIDLAVLVPPSFITTYALAHGVNRAFSYQLLAILNAASVIGRGLPGIIADRWGRFNVMILSSLGCTLLIVALWMFAGDSVVAITMFSILFGASSGTAYSLTPVCVSQLCRTENYGTRYGTAYGIVSFATLAGIPVSGLILSGNGGGNYRGLIWFCGILYAIATGLFTLARAIGTGWKLLKIY